MSFIWLDEFHLTRRVSLRSSLAFIFAWDGRSQLEKFYQFKLIFSSHGRIEAEEDRDAAVGERAGTAGAAEGEVAGGCDENNRMT